MADFKLSAYNAVFSILLIVLSVVSEAQQISFDQPERGFTSWKPAVDWKNGLLSGNGTMGAIVFGNPHEETIILSHAMLYLPRERSATLIDQADKLDEIRTLIDSGRYEAAAKIPVTLREEAGYTDERDPFIPAFDINITQEPANISRYRRATNFETGETITTWVDDVGIFERRLFVSRVDSVMVLSIKSDQPINCTIQFDRRPVEWNQWAFVNEHVDEMTATANGMWLTYKSSFKKKYPGSLEGYEGVGRLILKGGTSSVKGKTLHISNAGEVMLLVKIEPNYHYKTSRIPKIKQALQSIDEGYDGLLQNHKAIHGEIFNRVKLDLKSSDENKRLHTEEALLKASQEGPSLALIENVFDAGRYNILSSTGTNPPNLQGIWSGTWTAPWSSGFTHDGNLPSAMASVMSGNMPELMQAYVQYHQRYFNDYKETANRLFGTRGINLPAHTTTSGWPTDFNQTWCLTLWTGGAGWAADIMYDYYRYTLDRQYLEKYAYPWLKQTAWFYEDFLYKNATGEYVVNPSYSPENTPANSQSQAAINATMDVMIAKQVLTNAIEAGTILNEEKGQLKKWRSMLEKMPDYQINEDQMLREWLGDLKDNYRHRHVSQLYSLFNHQDQEIMENESLKQGAINLIDKKLKFREEEGGGEMAFGLVQLGLSAAHLGEAEMAYATVEWLSSKYWSTGLGSFHNVGELLNTDISGGLPAVIIDMLVYAGKGKIEMLPALPENWKEGTVSGILLRNQITLEELSWDENKITVRLITPFEQETEIVLPEGINTGYRLKDRKQDKLIVKNKRAFIVLPANELVILQFAY